MDKVVECVRDIHNDLRNHAKISEAQKPLIVSGILIALSDSLFRHKYMDCKSAPELVTILIASIQHKLEDAIGSDQIAAIIQPYSFITVHSELIKDNTLLNLIKKIEKNIYTIADTGVDLAGEFYKEFLRYSGGDKRGLGIVLTPQHITELFCAIAELTPESIVFDPCCGTAGFLISAMKYIENRTNLIGVEQSPDMFALAASNMILRSNDKINLYMGDCFSYQEQIKKHGPTVGFINPPYSRKGDELNELNFVKFMLDCLAPNGVGIAIVPISCAIATNKVKAEILKHHTLEAVINMRNDLFYKVYINTCIMVFTAHKPHDNKIPSWFARWQNDGFVTVTNQGKVDVANRWPIKMAEWVAHYKNRNIISGTSICQAIGPDDEWCVDAYVDTDYSNITTHDFLRVLAAYVNDTKFGYTSAVDVLINPPKYSREEDEA